MLCKSTVALHECLASSLPSPLWARVMRRDPGCARWMLAGSAAQPRWPGRASPVRSGAADSVFGPFIPARQAGIAPHGTAASSARLQLISHDI